MVWVLTSSQHWYIKCQQRCYYTRWYTSVSDNATFMVTSQSTGSIITPSEHINLLNGNATTVNIGGAATTLNLGATTGTTDIRNNLDVGGDLDVEGGDSNNGQQVLSDNGSSCYHLKELMLWMLQLRQLLSLPLTHSAT